MFRSRRTEGPERPICNQRDTGKAQV